jgi:hypothetical protein
LDASNRLASCLSHHGTLLEITSLEIESDGLCYNFLQKKPDR